jgi:hypothetical protein
LYVSGGGCEVQAFGKKHTFTSDLGGDAGTFTKKGKAITESFTAGDDTGLTASGTYSKSTHDYALTFGGLGAGYSGTLDPGVGASC